MHVGPDFEACSLQLGREGVAALRHDCFLINLMRESGPGQGSPCCLWQFCFCAYLDHLRLAFSQRWSHADLHLGLGLLPSALWDRRSEAVA